jgi:hypothetical protein
VREVGGTTFCILDADIDSPFQEMDVALVRRRRERQAHQPVDAPGIGARKRRDEVDAGSLRVNNMGRSEIHIVAGPSAAACLREGLALTRDQMLIHYDLLSCGPLRSLESLEDWRNLRQGYLQSLDSEDQSFRFADKARDVLTHCEELRQARTITLWLGTGLAEQLMLVWVVALLHRLGISADTCRVIQYNLDRAYEVVAVGVLDPPQFKEHPEPVVLDDASVREATAAWEAVTASEPDALLTFLSDQRGSLPFLQRSLISLLYHYPDLSTGLNAWEYQLLQYTRAQGPKATRVVGYTMVHDVEFPEWMGDTYLFQRLHRLADTTLPKPLLTLSGDTTRLRETDVRLTQHGEAVLAGKGNAVDWNGIDDWVAGVHLNSRNGRVWFRKERTLVPGA